MVFIVRVSRPLVVAWIAELADEDSDVEADGVFQRIPHLNKFNDKSFRPSKSGQQSEQSN
jgi:hypothetical protein